MPYKNQKRNIIISLAILLAGVFIGGYLVLSSKIGSADLSQQIMGFFGAGNQQQNEKTKDADQDGLTDWQEEIYKTDPLNPDTDGDGYLDGEEVMSGYDPLKPAPNDKLSDKAIEPRPKPGSLQINLTDALAKALLAEMQKTKAEESFIVKDDDTVELKNSQLIDNALIAALSKSPQLNFVPAVQDSDIKISSEDNLAAGQKFVEQITAITSQNINFEKSEMEAAQEIIQTKNYSLLDKYIKGYKNLFLAAKEIPAPPSWKEIHKKNLALIIATANILETIKLIDDDPLRAVIALQQYQQIVLPGLQQIGDDGLNLIKQQRGIQ